MEKPSISQDDIEDVKEMTDKLESMIEEIFRDNDERLAMSSFMSASINCMLAQCKTLDQTLFYRNMFISVLDLTISQMQINPPNHSSS